MTVDKLIDRIRKIYIIKLLVQVLDLPEVQDAVADMNRVQLSEGKTKTGKDINPEYVSDEYATAKVGLNSKPGFGIPDLFLSGDFYEGLTAELKGSGIEIFSTDPKNDKLESKYKDIFGLTNQNLEKLKKEFVLPELLILIRNGMQL